MITEMIIVGAIRKKMGLPPLKFFNVSPPSEGTNVLLASARAKEEQSSTPEPRVASGASSASPPNRGLPAWLPGLRSRPSTGAWSRLSTAPSLVPGASYAALLDLGWKKSLATPGVVQSGLEEKGFSNVRVFLTRADAPSELTSLGPGDGPWVTGTWSGPAQAGALPSEIVAAWVKSTPASAPAQPPAARPAPAPSPGPNPYARQSPARVAVAPSGPVDVTQKPGWIVPVKAVQQALIRWGFLPAIDVRTGRPSDDGWRGASTDTAVRAFQTYANLPVNGIVDARFMQLVTKPMPQVDPSRAPRPVPRTPRPPRRTSPQGTPAPGPAPAPAPPAPTIAPDGTVLDQDPTHPPADAPGGTANAKKPGFLSSLSDLVSKNPWAAGAVAIAAVSVTALSLAPSSTPIILQRS